MSTLKWHGREAAARIRRALPGALAAAAMVVETEAKGNIRTKNIIDTGNLLGSVTHEVSGDRARAGTNVEYGIYHEYGTYKMGARPWLRPAADEHQDEVRRAVAAVLRRAI